MHISEKLGQYNRNVTQNISDELKGATGRQKMVSSVGELQKGSIFEGTVKSVHGSKVILALSDGQLISAFMEGKVNLSVGSPMFFQVKSNEGEVVSIRPYTVDGNSGNPILLNALTTAGIAVNERNLAMVDAMMQEQMPIDKQSMLAMVKVANVNPNVDIKTLVAMVKLGLPVSEVTASQFENYQSNEHTVLKELNQTIEQIVNQPGSKEIPAETAVKIHQQMLEILFPEKTGESNVHQFSTVGVQPLESILTESQLANLNKLLQNVPALAGNEQLYPNVTAEEVFVDTMQEDATKLPVQAEVVGEGEMPKLVLDGKMTVAEFVKAVQSGIISQQDNGFVGVQKLFSSVEYRTLLRNVIEEQWLMKPEDFKSSEEVNELYERLDRQIRQLETMLQAAGLKNQAFSNAATEVRSNVEFMNQVNQLYNYVQVPLRMTGQNASSELYVYTNKKNLQDPDAEVSAFLHLDLNHLGSTDVSIKMLRKNVKTNFYFSNDESYALVKAFLPNLEKKLEEKGYRCTFTVKNEANQVDFMADFLRRDCPQAGALHRYSFDVKA